MKVSLSLDNSNSEDVAVVVDVLRASTTITVATKNFQKIVPVKDIEKAQDLAKRYDAVLAGERRGAAIKGFDTGNSPREISKIHGNVLVITTSNGTRIMEGIQAKILIGSFVNARAVAREAIKRADSHVEIVMAGVEGRFAIEDYLGAGEIISHLKDHDLDENALGACMASLNKELVNRAVKNSRSARKLGELGLTDDVNFCLKRNLYDHVPVYENGSITGDQ